MVTHRTAEEVREEYLRVLGSQLGPLYHALVDEVTWLHQKWIEYRKLYAGTEKRIDLLNETAGFFFRVVQDVFWDDTLLHLARLTDRTDNGGKQNLTVLRLPQVITDSSMTAEVQSLIDDAVLKCSFAKDWRNRHLAHRDLNLTLGAAEPLRDASRQHVEDALFAIRAVLNRIEQHYFGSEVAFTVSLAIGDANCLVHHLAFAARAEELQQRRLEQGNTRPEDLEPPPEA